MAVESQSPSSTDRAKEQVQEKAQVAQEKLQETAGTARSRMREQVDQRSTQAAEQIHSTAHALRSTSERLREEGQDGPARAAERMADRAERVGGYLRESDADRILNDVEDFGRRQPWAVVGIGLFAGFAASRFLKASSRSRYEQRSSGMQAPRRPGADRIPASLGGGHGGVPANGTGTPAMPAGPATPGVPETPSTAMPVAAPDDPTIGRREAR